MFVHYYNVNVTFLWYIVAWITKYYNNTEIFAIMLIVKNELFFIFINKSKNMNKKVFFILF